MGSYRKYLPSLLVGLAGGALGAFCAGMAVRGLWSEIAAAWAAAIANIGLAAVAVGVPWNERRLRLRSEEDARVQLYTRRDNSSGLRLIVRYLAPDRNEGLFLVVSVVEPNDCVVIPGVQLPRGDFATRLNMNYEVTASVPLEPSVNDTDGRLVGSIFVLQNGPDPGPSKATVRYKIQTAVSGRILMDRTVAISPLGESAEATRLSGQFI